MSDKTSTSSSAKSWNSAVCTFLLFLGNRTVGKVFVYERFPTGHFFIAPIEPQIYRKAHGSTHVMARDWVLCQRVGVIAVIVMAVNVPKQTPGVFAQGII